MLSDRSVFVTSACLGVALLCAAPSRVAGRQDRPPIQAPSSMQQALRAVSGSVTVKSLALEGSRGTGTELMKVPPSAPGGRVELLFLFPEQYRQMFVNPSMMSYRGFSRDVPLLGAKAIQSDVTVNAGTPAVNFVDTQRVVAARLLFGILGDAGGIMRVTATPAGPGTWHLVGANDFDCLIDLDRATGVPLRVRYTDMVGFLPPYDPAEKQWHSDPPERAEVTITFADRRSVDGIQIPFRVTTTARSLSTGRQNVREEVRFERVRVNPPLTPADFSRVQ
jgi:hypothetical protein